MDVLTGRYSALRDLYTYDGPFVSVYLDATRATESGAHEVELRWSDVRARLAADGASEADLAAVDAAVDGDRGTPGRHGLFVVAAGGAVRFTAPFRPAPPLSSGRVGPLPHLLPFLALEVDDVPHVVVVADRTGADIYLAGTTRTEAEQVQGSEQHPISRTGRDSWSERHFQNRVENTWAHNARDVAQAVVHLLSKAQAQLVVVAGDVRARSLVAEDLADVLPDRAVVRVVDSGGRADGASPEALDEAVREEVLHELWRQRRATLGHLQQNLGRDAYAVAGVPAVVAALRKSQADTVVLSDDPSSTLRAWVGREPTDFGTDREEAAATGVEHVQEDRFDAALVRAVIGTGAHLVVTPGAHAYVADGVGALLRYEDRESNG